MMAKITKSTIIHEAIKGSKSSSKVLGDLNMGCKSCSGAKYETLEWGANMHGVDIKELLKKLSSSLKK